LMIRIAQDREAGMIARYGNGSMIMSAGDGYYGAGKVSG